MAVFTGAAYNYLANLHRPTLTQAFVHTLNARKTLDQTKPLIVFHPMP